MFYALFWMSDIYQEGWKGRPWNLIKIRCFFLFLLFAIFTSTFSKMQNTCISSLVLSEMGDVLGSIQATYWIALQFKMRVIVFLIFSQPFWKCQGENLGSRMSLAVPWVWHLPFNKDEVGLRLRAPAGVGCKNLLVLLFCLKYTLGFYLWWDGGLLYLVVLSFLL